MALTQERLLQLIERSPDIIVATDRKGTVIYYNDGAAKSLGYSGPEIRGRLVSELYPSLDEAKRVMKAMRDGGGSVETFPTRLLSKSGEVIPVAITGTLLRDEAGEARVARRARVTAAAAQIDHACGADVGDGLVGLLARHLP